VIKYVIPATKEEMKFWEKFTPYIFLKMFHGGARRNYKLVTVTVSHFSN
jgi:hypothetical protein